MFYSSICGGDKWREQGINEGDISKNNSLRSQNFLSTHPLSTCVLRLCLTLYVIFPNLWRGQVDWTRKKGGGYLKENFARFARKTFCRATHFHAICYIPQFVEGTRKKEGDISKKNLLASHAKLFVPPHT